MNKKENGLIIRLDERVKRMHDDIHSILNKMDSIQGCINSNELAITTLKQQFTDHLTAHKALYGGLAIAIPVISLIIHFVLIAGGGG